MKLDKHKLATLILSGFLSAGCAEIASTVSSIPGVPESVKPAVDIAQKTGTKAIDASKEISDSEEYYLGRGVAARILSQHSLSKDEALNTYVNKVGRLWPGNLPGPGPIRGITSRFWKAPRPIPLPVPGASSSSPRDDQILRQ